MLRNLLNKWKAARGNTNHQLRRIPDIITYIIDELFSARFKCYEIHGAEKIGGTKLILIYIGNGRSLAYLKQLLFRDIYQCSVLRDVSLIRLFFRFRIKLPKSDLRVAEFTPLVMRLLRYKSRFETPNWIEQELNIEGHWDGVLKRFRKNNRTTILRKIKKHQFTYDIVNDRDNIEYFCDNMLFPRVTQRFQDAVEIMDRDYIIDVAKNGGLLRILRNGEFIAGGVISYEPDSVDAHWISGALNQQKGNIISDAYRAIYYFLIKHAYDRGYKFIKLGTTRPFLNDGVYRFKRMWGATIIKSRTADTTISFDFNFKSESIQTWLKSSPFLVEHNEEFLINLFCFTGTDMGNIASLLKNLISPEMTTAIIYSLDIDMNVPAKIASCNIQHKKVTLK